MSSLFFYEILSACFYAWLVSFGFFHFFFRSFFLYFGFASGGNLVEWLWLAQRDAGSNVTFCYIVYTKHQITMKYRPCLSQFLFYWRFLVTVHNNKKTTTKSLEILKTLYTRSRILYIPTKIWFACNTELKPVQNQKKIVLSFPRPLQFCRAIVIHFWFEYSFLHFKLTQLRGSYFRSSAFNFQNQSFQIYSIFQFVLSSVVFVSAIK